MKMSLKWACVSCVPKIALPMLILKYPHETQDGPGQDCGKYAVDDYAKCGECSILLAEFCHSGSADDMSGCAHAYASCERIDYMAIRKHLEPEYCSGQSNAYHNSSR